MRLVILAITAHRVVHLFDGHDFRLSLFNQDGSSRAIGGTHRVDNERREKANQKHQAKDAPLALGNRTPVLDEIKRLAFIHWRLNRTELLKREALHYWT